MRGAGFLAFLLILGCAPREERVDASRYDAFWLWAGVTARPGLGEAKTLYLLDGEIRGAPARYVALRPGIPRLPGKALWLVVRTNELDWPDGAADKLVAKLDRWAAAGNQVEGLQVDFDAATRGLDRYNDFLGDLRRRLPRRYKLSITGLMDWSAHGDPRALAGLASIVDEVVIQTYQGRSTIPGYDAYLARLSGFPIPFKIGLVEQGAWREPAGLPRNPRFKGYVIFLVAARRS